MLELGGLLGESAPIGPGGVLLHQDELHGKTIQAMFGILTYLNMYLPQRRSHRRS